MGGEERVGLAREKGSPPPSRVVSRPNSLTLPFRTPATQAIGNTNMVASRLIKREKGSLPVDVRR